MADLLNAASLWWFMFLVLPGFVALSVYDLLVPGPRRQFAKYSVELISIGLLNLALISPLLSGLLVSGWPADHEVLGRVLLGMCLVALPAMEAITLKALRTWKRLTAHLIHPMPMPWDYFFDKNRLPFLMRFALRKGGWVRGLYGPGSCSSSFPDQPQVYLAEQWCMTDDGAFDKPSAQSKGMLISFSECEFAEMISIEVSVGKEQDEPGRV